MSLISSLAASPRKPLLVAGLVIAFVALSTSFVATGQGVDGSIPQFEVTSTAGSAITCQVGSVCPFWFVGHGVRTEFSTGGVGWDDSGVVKVVSANGSIFPGRDADFEYGGDYICTSAGTGAIRALWQAGPGNEPGALTDGITVTCES